MSINPSDLIGLAQQLVAGDSECEWRSGASRAYYAAYHKALGVADGCLPPSPYATGVHQQLTDRLLAQGRQGTALAYKLIDLKRVRTHADYFLTKPFSRSYAAMTVADAIAFVPEADAFQAHMEIGAQSPS
jgi:hypothetical protein